jgi:hypothetical protein
MQVPRQGYGGYLYHGEGTLPAGRRRRMDLPRGFDRMSTCKNWLWAKADPTTGGMPLHVVVDDEGPARQACLPAVDLCGSEEAT